MFRLNFTGRVACTALLAVVVGTATGCWQSRPFDFVPVSGKVTYEDGSLISAARIDVTFEPQTPPLDPKTYPPQGLASVNVETGEFELVTSRSYGDGIVPGEHKVVIQTYTEQGTPAYLVPPEYTSVADTPIVVDAADAPFTFAVPKPRGR